MQTTSTHPFAGRVDPLPMRRPKPRLAVPTHREKSQARQARREYRRQVAGIIVRAALELAVMAAVGLGLFWAAHWSMM